MILNNHRTTLKINNEFNKLKEVFLIQINNKLINNTGRISIIGRNHHDC